MFYVKYLLIARHPSPFWLLEKYTWKNFSRTSGSSKLISAFSPVFKSSMLGLSFVLLLMFFQDISILLNFAWDAIVSSSLFCTSSNLILSSEITLRDFCSLRFDLIYPFHKWYFLLPFLADILPEKCGQLTFPLSICFVVTHSFSEALAKSLL